MDFALAASSAYGAGRTTGLVAVFILCAALVRQFLWLRRDQSTGLKRALVFGGIAVMIFINIGRVFGGDDNSWDSAHGIETKAHFIDSCQSGAGAAVSCECVFERVTAAAPYDTPDGFTTLTESTAVPPLFQAAFRACRLPGSQPAPASEPTL